MVNNIVHSSFFLTKSSKIKYVIYLSNFLYFKLECIIIKYYNYLKIHDSHKYIKINKYFSLNLFHNQSINFLCTCTQKIYFD